MTDTTPEYVWLDESAVQDGSYVPALDTLSSHKASLREDLMAGFASLYDVLLWQHAVSVATFGQVSSSWLTSLYSNRWKLAALLNNHAAREAVTPHPPSDETAHGERLRIMQNHLLPAFSEATVLLRERAGDYSDSDPVDDVDDQQFVAMRPRLHQRAIDQHSVLRRALGRTEQPLTTHEDILLWVSDLTDATDGYLDSNFADRVTARMGSWRTALLDEGASVWVLTQLGDEVLPVMNDSLRDAAERSNEKAKTPYRATEVPQG